MNLVLLEEDDFAAEGKARLLGRRRDHVLAVHRVSAGDSLTVGLLGGKIGRGTVTSLDPLELDVVLTDDPPPPLDVTLVLALPRPKVLNRVLAGATSLGVKRIYLINAWRVEKSYWKSPRLSDSNLREQRILGLEQARDTVMPALELRRLFRPFVEEELAALARGRSAIVAHPYGASPLPSVLSGPITLAIGPEGGFIAKEVESLEAVGFEPMTLGPRILRVETAVPAILGRM